MERKPDREAAAEAARALPEEGRGRIRSDVLGSYTGTGERGERPVQDADDL